MCVWEVGVGVSHWHSFGTDRGGWEEEQGGPRAGGGQLHS